MALATRPKPTAHHKKRQAKHHRHNKHYLKPYWPYLPMVLVIAMGVLINTAWSQHSVLGVQRDFSNQKLLEDTNKERGENQQASLKLNAQLSAAAQAKANDMALHNYWSHISPDGQTPWTFIGATGYQYQSAGENLAYGFGNADQTITGWMNSPEHRANMLDKGYQDVGFGIAQSSDFQGQGPQTIVVAEYATPTGATTQVTAQVQNTPVSKQTDGTATEIQARNVARIQTITGGQAIWSLVFVSAIIGSALTIFTVRHGYRIHRLLTRSEMFVVHHPWLDVALVAIIIVGYLLTRTSGIIR